MFILFGWISIFVSHIGYRRKVAWRSALPVNFRMPGAPVTNYICLAFLIIVALYIMFDFSNHIVLQPDRRRGDRGGHHHWLQRVQAQCGQERSALISARPCAKKSPWIRSSVKVGGSIFRF